SARSLRPRKGSTKLQLPLAPRVMKQIMEMSASAPSTRRTKAGRDSLPMRRTLGAGTGTVVTESGCIGTRPEQEIKENHAADYANDDADRDFIGRAQDATQDIAGENEARAHDRHPGHGAAHVVADHEADEIWDDEPEKRDGADGNQHDG